MQSIIGKKIGQTQKFLSDGNRVPVTVVEVKKNIVSIVRTIDKDGYFAVQLGTNDVFREIRYSDNTSEQDLPKKGDFIEANSVLEPGDIVDVVGVSKGKGFAGFVKRHHFKGGPKTHGQSDRQRAPGAVSSGTTPGRIRKGKRMAGRMGNAQVTVKNLQIIAVSNESVFIKGLVPGVSGTFITINKTNKKVKKFVDIAQSEPLVPEVKKEEVKTSPNSTVEKVNKENK